MSAGSIQNYDEDLPLNPTLLPIGDEQTEQVQNMENQTTMTNSN